MSSPSSAIRLLLVDDEQDQLRLAKIGLESLGKDFIIETTDTPDKALNLIHNTPYDCVVSDYLMPSMTGIDLYKKLRGEGNTVPFIIFTGHGSEEVAARAFEVGVDDYLMKERKLAIYTVLAKQIRQVVEKRRTEKLLQDTLEELAASNEELRAQADELRESEEQFRKAIEEAPIPVIMRAEDGQVIQVSRTWTELTGYTYDDMRTFEDWTNRAYGKAADDVRRHIRELFRGDTGVIRMELSINAKNGEIRNWIYSVSSPGTLRDGRRFVIGMAVDITERKRYEEELRAANVKIQEYASRLEQMVEQRTAELRMSEERLRSFIDSAPDQFWIYSPDLRLIEVNSKGLEYLSAKKEDVIGRRMEEISPGIENTERYRRFLQVLETGEPTYIMDFQPALKSGEVWLELWAFKMVENLGLISRDVTARRRMEERLRREEHMNSISRIGATIAHDLRGPLINVVQSLELVEKKPDQAPNMMRMAKESSRRALNMIEEFRAGTREVKVIKQNVNLTSLVKEVVDSIRLPENIDLDMQTRENPMNVHLDPEVIRRVLDNLIRNAVEAMPDGGHLTVSSKKEGDKALLIVGDTGIGISEEKAKHIFEPLFTTKAKGMGLGLFFVRIAVEAHGGMISFASKLGEGTTFTVRLPT